MTDKHLALSSMKIIFPAATGVAKVGGGGGGQKGEMGEGYI